jgi:hypothetical protein
MVLFISSISSSWFWCLVDSLVVNCCQLFCQLSQLS